MLCFAVLFAACGPNVKEFDGFVAAMKSSSQDCKTAQADLEVKDGGVVVYGYTRKLERTDSGFRVTETERKLNDEFVLGESVTTSEVSSGKDAAALPVNLTQESVSDCTIEDGVLKGTITSSAAMSAVLGTQKFAMNGTAALECKLVKKKIAEINLSYQTTDGKLVTVKIVYSY